MELKINKFAELTNRTLTTPAQVFGKNGAGKTTLYNAYLWCLTGKGKDGNDMNEAVYSVKDEPTERIADVEVKIGGRTFHKVCRPIFQRPRGSAEMQLKTLCSNTYELDSVEVTMKQYNEAVANLCKGQSFNMFSDIDYFSRVQTAKQIAIFMELCGVDRADYMSGLRDIAVIKKELQQVRTEIKEENKFNDERKSELNSIVLPQDYSDEIKAKQAEIEALQNQRPTLTAEQVAENNEISRKIAELQNYPHKVVSCEKRRKLNELRDNFNAELNNRNDLVRLKMKTENDIKEAEKDLENWQNSCEMPSNLPEIEYLKRKIAGYEFLKQKETDLLENYEEANKNASCGLCPHCTEIFCEHRKTDLPSEDDLRRNIESYLNEIAGLRAKIAEIAENWEKNQNAEHDSIIARISDLKANFPNIAEADKRLEEARKAVEIAEIEAEKETKDNEALATENEQKRRENETKIAELKAKIHIAQVAATDNKLFSLKAELSNLQAKQKDFDEKATIIRHTANNIEKAVAKVAELTDKAVELEREQIAYEQADGRFREAVQSKANSLLPDGMTINLFRPLISGEGYEQVFELTYANKKYKNTALQIWGNFELTKVLQRGFGVELPIFVDDMANITEDEFLPYGENVVQLVAVKGCELCIEPMSY